MTPATAAFGKFKNAFELCAKLNLDYFATFKLLEKISEQADQLGGLTKAQSDSVNALIIEAFNALGKACETTASLRDEVLNLRQKFKDETDALLGARTRGRICYSTILHGRN